MHRREKMRTRIMLLALLLQLFLLTGNAYVAHRKIILGRLPNAPVPPSNRTNASPPAPPHRLIIGKLPKNEPIPPTAPSNRRNTPAPPAAIMKFKGKVPHGPGFVWNDDALMEILLRLPAKSLIRFKLVCKQWLSLISSDHFSRLHTLRHPKLQPSLILKMRKSFYFNTITNGEKLVIPYRFSIPNLNIINSCNGLMLLQSDPPEECVYVYNPTTRQSRKISLCSSHSNKCPYVVNLVLAFDPSKSPHYKIVCTRSTDSHKKWLVSPDICIYQMEVYDSESRTWKQGMEPTSCTFYIPKYGGVYFDGLVYWDSCPRMYYFDIATNDLKETYQPDCCPETEDQGVITICSPHLQVSNGHLYRCLLMSGKCESVVVWEVQGGDPSKWLLMYNDIVSQLPFDYMSCPTPIQLRFVEGSYGAETCWLVFLRSGKVRVYNFLYKSHKEILDLRGRPFKCKQYDLVSCEFGESLAVV